MAPRPYWWKILQAAKDEAREALDHYNRPVGGRALEGWLVHMHVAWLNVCHALLLKSEVDIRYWHGRQLDRNADGSVRLWDLRRCIKELFKDNDPIRHNIDFFIPFRDGVEHRHEAAIEAVVAGRVQANVMNFEQLVTDRFGKSEGLGASLRLPVFLSTLSADAEAAVRAAHANLPPSMRRYIAQIEDALAADILNSPQYELRFYLLPLTGPKSEADAPLRFYRPGEALPQEAEAVGNLINVITKVKHVPVVNAGLAKPKAVAAAVQAMIPWRFTANDNAAAWKFYQVRPAEGSSDPTNTKIQYCIWDTANGCHLYTQSWIDKLAAELQTPDGYRNVIGHQPIAK